MARPRPTESTGADRVRIEPADADTWLGDNHVSGGADQPSFTGPRTVDALGAQDRHHTFGEPVGLLDVRVAPEDEHVDAEVVVLLESVGDLLVRPTSAVQGAPPLLSDGLAGCPGGSPQVRQTSACLAATGPAGAEDPPK